MNTIRIFAAGLVAGALALAALAQQAPTESVGIEIEKSDKDPAPVDFDRLEDFLERFSRTTIDAIEQEMDRRLERYESELEKKEAPVADVQANAPQYELVFEIPGISGEISVLSAGGRYEINSSREKFSSDPNQAASQVRYKIRVEGTVSGGAEGVRVAFDGDCQVTMNSGAGGPQDVETVQLDFDGTAGLKPGVKRTLVRDGETSVVVTIREVDPSAP